MTVLDKLAFFQNRNDETPNQELARELANSRNVDGIREIAENLHNKNRNIRNDCIKVLYETGYFDPQLISEQVSDFLLLIKSSDNRLVWGAMIALSLIADIKAGDIYLKLEDVYSAIRQGSVITIDNGIKVLSKVASVNERYCYEIFPKLLGHIRTYIAKQIPQHAESMLVAVNAANCGAFIDALRSREDQMTPPQLVRIRKIYKKLEKIYGVLN